MATFYVPIERKALPASDPKRWFFLAEEAPDPVTAIAQASTTARDVMRLKGVAVWAAVRDIPSFEHMQELRDALGKASRKGAKVVAGYA